MFRHCRKTTAFVVFAFMLVAGNLASAAHIRGPVDRRQHPDHGFFAKDNHSGNYVENRILKWWR